MKHIHEVSPGQSLRLAEIGGERTFRRRLMELGFLPGTLVRLVRRVDIGGLVELEVRGSHIGLRHSEASQLLFERER